MGYKIVVLLVLLAVSLGSCGNINAYSCPITGGCLQCLISRSPELQHCLRQAVLITETSNHKGRSNLYCAGDCPLMLATAGYLCGPTDLKFFFKDCSFYDVQPRGQGSYFYEDDPNDSCFNHNSGFRCQHCLYSQSIEALACLQHQILIQGTNNTAYREPFCDGNCAVTLGVANLYCGSQPEAPFDECAMNQGRRFCKELVDEMNTDEDVTSCVNNASITGNCLSPTCVDAERRYGCCLADSGHTRASLFERTCEIEACTMIETGGSPAHLATPLVLIMMLIFVALQN